MMFRIFLYIIGFGIAVAGGISTVAYLNYLTIGHTYMDYLLFISTRVECYLLPVGIILIWLSIYYPPWSND